MMNHHYRLNRLTAQVCATKPSTKPASDPSGLFGRGYAHSEQIEVLPTLPPGATFDDKMRAKYEEFQEKRRKGPDAMSQFLDLAADGSPFQEANVGYGEDPYTPPSPARAPETREVDVVIIGGGWAGLLVSARLSEAGFTDQILFEKGGDVGGTWYWNRYPGVAVDVESYSYMPLLEETGYVPQMSYASGFEIHEHCQRVADQYKVYDKALFHTTVTSTTWDMNLRRWIVGTSRNDSPKARFVLMANGVMTQPKLANLPGMRSFKGTSFHTSRWDYSLDLRGKKVGIIGTGATASQCIPELAKVVGHLYVFMRTPSSIDVRNNVRTSEEFKERMLKTPGWALKRRALFDAGLDPNRAEDAAPAAGTPTPREAQQARRKANQAALTREEINRKKEEGNFRVIERIRMRVENTVKDPVTAEALKPYYVFMCKRPVFHDEYLTTFNRPNVTLVNTDGKGVERIGENGPVVAGTEYSVDHIVYATGFQFMKTGTFNTIKGRTGVTLEEKWSTGTKTFMGLHTNGFPNLFIMSGPQAAGAAFNFMGLIEKQCEYISNMLLLMKEKNAWLVDVDPAMELKWSEHCADADRRITFLRSCISYYNQEGTKRPGDLDYNAGAVNYNKWMDQALSLLHGGPAGDLITQQPFSFES